MSEDTSKNRWHVDYWHPGHPVYDHYHSKAFADERRKGQEYIKTQWEKWLQENSAKQTIVEQHTIVPDCQPSMTIPTPVLLQDVQNLDFSPGDNKINTSNLMVMSICFTLATLTSFDRFIKSKGRVVSFSANSILVIVNLVGWFYFFQWVFGSK